MSDLDLAIRLIVEGYVVVPGVFDANEVAAASDAFEQLANQHDTRRLDWDVVRTSPALLHGLAHPRLMAVVDKFCAHFHEEAIIAGCSSVRDAFNGQPGEPRDYSDLRHAPVGWHDDVSGVKDPCFSAMHTSLTALLYLDDTFKDNGAYCSVVGSHVLAFPDANDRSVVSPAEVALDHCKLVQVPVKAGDAIIHRAHNWHGVVRPQQRRRLILQHTTTRTSYNDQQGHTEFKPEDLAKMPPDRQRYFTHYANA